MNKLIFRKLSYDILLFFLLSSVAITAIIWVIQGVNLLDIVSEQGHDFKVYFIYSILNIPKIFSKILIFAYFLTLFVIISRYQDNNEILVFWTNGIKKITFINFIAKFSFFFMLLQLSLNLYIVPHTQNLAQEYLKNSSIEFFPKLLKEKKFSRIMQNITIFVQEYDENEILKGIYIKEKLKKNEDKIIIAKKGELIKSNNGFIFKLTDGTITNLDTKGNFNLGFKETIYDLTKFNSITRKEKKLNETETSLLIYCLERFLDKRKDSQQRCGKENKFLLKDIYEEIFKRAINPAYIVFLSLVSSLIILKPKIINLQNYFKIFLFFFGFSIILFSELSYKFISKSAFTEVLSIFLPIIFVIIFYFYILLKSKFRISYL